MIDTTIKSNSNGVNMKKFNTVSAFNQVQQQKILEAGFTASINPVKYINSIDCSDLSYNDEYPELPPFNNMGGINVTSSFSSCSALTPPVQINCKIDYLSCSFQFSNDDVMIDSELEIARLIVSLKVYIPNLLYYPRPGGLYGYKRSIGLTRMGQQSGLIGYVGNNNTCLISLSGQGCVGVDMIAFRAYLETLPACKITRVDMAHDDLQGTVTVQQYKALYQGGSFHIKGTAPAGRFIDDFGSGKGCTLYVGSKKNGKEACIYEKGKQLGDENSLWVRVEGRLTSIDRVIPFDVLTSPEQYLSGLYPPFSMLSDIQKVIEIIKKHCDIAFESLIEYASIAYGKLINCMIKTGISDSQIVAKLVREGMPKRLANPLMQLENSIPF